MQIFDAPDVTRLLHPDHRAAADAALAEDPLALLHDHAPADEWLDRLMYTDLKSYLAECVLVKVDRMTMAHGIEARCPLLDHRLVELAARLPSSYKRAPGAAGKRILRAVAAGALPEWLLALPKRGFDLPVVQAWMRGELRQSCAALLEQSTLVADGWLDGETLRAQLRPGDDGAASIGNRLWSLLVLELWYRQTLRSVSTADAATAG
jgi:asparagine synthase (glutamine-hydrolysing)